MKLFSYDVRTSKSAAEDADRFGIVLQDVVRLASVNVLALEQIITKASEYQGNIDVAVEIGRMRRN